MDILPHIEIDGIKCYAPELARNCKDYPIKFFQQLSQLEDNHFWFQSRNTVIRHLVSKYLKNTGERRRFLEIGCGTGCALKALSEDPLLECTGAEIHIAGATIAKKRVPAAEIIQLDATCMPFEEQFDAIGAFDVIEHIENDETVIQNIHRALKPGGSLFLSVPQHPFSWSYQDKIAGHKRRYTRSSLEPMLLRDGFHLDYIGSFCCTLFPLMLLVRWIKNVPNEDTGWTAMINEFQIHPPLNRMLRALMWFDELLIRKGWSLPFGGSLFVVAHKKNHQEPGIAS